MRYLVTGGTGFIGSHLAESALRAGNEVNVLGLTDTPADAENAALLSDLGARVFSGSITDTSLCASALDGVDYVYHLAVAMREAGVPDQHFMRVNCDGTRALLDAAIVANVKRVIYCGTIGIFGHRFAGVCNEDSEKRPGNIYEKTKLAAEELALGYFASRGLETLSLRPADVYGPRDQRLLKLFRGVARGSFPMFGRGKGRRHMIFVSDVVSAFEKACTVQRGLGKAYIIAGPEVCTLYELVETIRKATGQPRYGFPLPLTPMLVAAAVTEDICATIGVAPPIYRRRMDFFTSDCAFDISRARDVLDWTPRVNLSEGVRLTLDAYRTAGLIATARAVQG